MHRYLKNRKNGDKTDRRAKIDAQTCLGCGACLPVCEKDALSLVARENCRVPPKNKGRMFTRILWEKGCLAPFVTSRIKRGLRLLVRH